MSPLLPASLPTQLYWSETGRIACSKHMPYRGSDTYRLERWRKMRPDEVAAYTERAEREPECQICVIDEQREEENARRGL